MAVYAQQTVAVDETWAQVETASQASILVAPTNSSNLEATPGAKQAKQKARWTCRATQAEPLFNLAEADEPLAVDIEFQNYRVPQHTKWHHRIGRVAVVNTEGRTLFDAYLAYAKEEGIKKTLPPKRFMVEWPDLMFENGAIPAKQRERILKKLFKNRTVIIHGGTHDLSSFYYEVDALTNKNGVTVVDTQRLYSHLQPSDGTPGLALCAETVLNETIQEEVHCPVEDSRTSMKLYLNQRPYDRAAAIAKRKAQYEQVRPGRQLFSRSNKTQSKTTKPAKTYAKEKSADGDEQQGKAKGASLTGNTGQPRASEKRQRKDVSRRGDNAKRAS